MFKNLRSKLFTPWMFWLAFLGVILLGGLAGSVLVFCKGLSLTNLSNLVIWVSGLRLIFRRLPLRQAHLVCVQPSTCSA